ncbi:MAG TPA: ATP-binding protein [Terracidiphilus sp.]|nr:ATP-binding protein [Terracidiphilus sp.]
MTLKTKIVLAITGLVFIITGLLSMVYMSVLLHLAVRQPYDTDLMGAEQIRMAVMNALETGLEGKTVNPDDPGALRALVADAVRNNDSLKAVINSVNSHSLTVYDINIGDSQGNTLVSTNPGMEDKPIPARRSYDQLLDDSTIQQMKVIFGPPQIFNITMPLDRNGQRLLTVNVGIHTSLVRAFYAPWLKKALTLMGLALALALLVAFLLGNLALRPMERISHQLDYWTAVTRLSAGPVEQEAVAQKGADAKKDMAERVSTKIEMIGQRIRNVEEVFSALKENLDQILGNLQDGIVLFTEDGRAVLVSEAAARYLQANRNHMIGKRAHEIFDRTTVLGQTLRQAFDAGMTLIQEEVRTETGRRLQVSVDFIHDDETRQGLGALVTLHDLESVEAIESELEVSRRMAAIGRLTSGVGHEVKNPINAIVVHLELLKSKLGDAGAPAARHLDVIEAEIRRLDRVVQTLADFSRPVELQLREQDLRDIFGDVLALASEELSTRNVTLLSQMPSNPLVANVDADLLKQAALNVIQNGAQAMPEGGTLEVVLEEDSKPGTNGDKSRSPGQKVAVLRISDEGPGIPEEIREKIFDLYFTTKSGGSGIGLAMTYRILQLHHGSIEVESNIGRGTEFRLRIPLAAADWGRRHLQPADETETKGLAG